MANTKSAEKANQQAQKRRARNQHVLTTLRTQIRAVREALAKKDQPLAEAALKAAVRLIDKAASKGVIHARNASRRVARLTKAVRHPAAQPGA